LNHNSRITPGRRAVLLTLVGLYALAGVLHLIFPRPFLAITPHWVPWATEVIRFTGLCELLGAGGLILPHSRKLEGAMLALYAVCVFPANLNHAFWLGGDHPSAWRWLYHGPRILVQPLVVWAPLWAAGLIDWPFRRRV